LHLAGQISNLPYVVIALCSVFLFLAGCAPASTPAPEGTSAPVASPTQAATASLAPTASVVWFPPTETPTPFPTPALTPTPDLLAGVGEPILEDDFSSGEAWSLGRTTAGSVALGKNELTIAIAEPEAYLSNLRQEPVLGDFYLEITASPTLCRGLDEYGLLLRASSPGDLYRFGLSCDGQVRFERLTGGTASTLLPWAYSGAVPPGAPSVSRLAVWAKDRELRFFVNGEYQFTIDDPYHPEGGLGLFARSAGENAVTVSFSELVVREINE
jgi:hypothetical protein